MESRHEGGKDLTFANRPRRRAAHDLLRQLGEWATEVFLPIAKRPHHSGRVAHDDAHDAEHRLVGEAMPLMNFLQSHASSNALRPATRRWREAPREALTTISNN